MSPGFEPNRANTELAQPTQLHRPSESTQLREATARTQKFELLYKRAILRTSIQILYALEYYAIEMQFFGIFTWIQMRDEEGIQILEYQ